jgi:hypothetical protein
MVPIFNRFNLKEMKALKNNVVLLTITESVQKCSLPASTQRLTLP